MIKGKEPILISDELCNKINNSTLQKMIFLYNSIQNGWTIRKLANNKYELKQNTTKEIRNDNYICKFVKDNFDISKLLYDN